MNNEYDRADWASERADELLSDPVEFTQLAVNELPFAMDSDELDQAVALLARLHTVEPADLLDSDLLTSMYRIAKKMHAIVEAAAMDKAENEALALEDEAYTMRVEQRTGIDLRAII